MNSAHERRVAEIAGELYPHLPISLSSELAPVLGEYERCATTVINAYLSPRVSVYLRDIDARLSANGLHARLMVMLSNGGVAPAEEAARKAAALLSSGPAGGVIGARLLGQRRRHNETAWLVGRARGRVRTRRRAWAWRWPRRERDPWRHHGITVAVPLRQRVGIGDGLPVRPDGVARLGF